MNELEKLKYVLKQGIELANEAARNVESVEADEILDEIAADLDLAIDKINQISQCEKS